MSDKFGGFDKEGNDGGALPPLDESLPAPTGETKSKTNVNKFALLAFGIIAFLFIVLAGMLWAKRQPTMVATQTAELAQKPGFAEKNAEIEAANIERRKAELREAAEREAAEAARIQAEFDEAERRAREARGTSAQAPQQQEDASERAMRTGVLLPLTGSSSSASANSSGGKGSGSGSGSSITEEEQRQREVNARMRAQGLNPGSGATGGGFGDAGALGASGGLSARLQPTILSATEAGRLRNLTYLLKKGTTIPCALKTGIDTQLPGFVLCNVINDVYSANGSTLLIERGATLFGEQQSQLKQGQDRTFVIWSRIDNPSGVTVDIDSPATDAMGFSGVPGIVDYHFMERFGAAILLTTIKDFSRALADRYSDNRGNSYTIGSDGSSMENMATEALKNTINIPPNLIVLPATVVHVMVARDVSFESVYELVK